MAAPLRMMYFLFPLLILTTTAAEIDGDGNTTHINASHPHSVYVRTCVRVRVCSYMRASVCMYAVVCMCM